MDFGNVERGQGVGTEASLADVDIGGDVENGEAVGGDVAAKVEHLVKVAPAKWHCNNNHFIECCSENIIVVVEVLLIMED